MNNQQFSSLPGAGQLLKESLKICKSRFWVFLGIMVIAFLIYLFLIYFFSALYWFGLYSDTSFTIFSIIMVTIYYWLMVSLVYAIKERNQKIGIKESLKKGWHKILSYWWLSILGGFIIMGGFLLLIIPGIIFTIWFSLAVYILVLEDRKGMDALLRSKQLVKGYWWKIFWRFLVMGFVVILIFAIGEIFTTYYLHYLEDITRIIISILIALFSITFGFLIYENLKQLK